MTGTWHGARVAFRNVSFVAWTVRLVMLWMTMKLHVHVHARNLASTHTSFVCDVDLDRTHSITVYAEREDYSHPRPHRHHPDVGFPV